MTDRVLRDLVFNNAEEERRERRMAENLRGINTSGKGALERLILLNAKARGWRPKEERSAKKRSGSGR